MKNITIKLFLMSLVFNYSFAEEATKTADEENELEETNEVFLEELVEDYEEIPGFLSLSETLKQIKFI
ncbi:MAG: hypothetical protein CM15mP86_07710 [Gammaproteobacteria bacterium]|nr:MAG: hypothetical protein CM15mP86_07710 [Gammaproteobacteria bacterium]